MTPAEELRKAAETLMEAVDGTTPTPWKVVMRYRRKYPTVPTQAVFITPGREKGVSLKYPHILPDTKWNALTSPALAAPLAAWLKECAGQADSMTTPDDFAPCDEPDSVKRALEVARVINKAASR